MFKSSLCKLVEWMNLGNSSVSLEQRQTTKAIALTTTTMVIVASAATVATTRTTISAATGKIAYPLILCNEAARREAMLQSRYQRSPAKDD